MRIFCVSMTVPVESRLTMRKSRNGLLRSPHGDRIGHRNPLSYKPPESLRSERLAALYYFVIVATTPAPTVRPPSRIAKRRPWSMAIGAISLTDSWTLSRSEEHTSELQSLMRISYAVFCLKKKKTTETKHH